MNNATHLIPKNTIPDRILTIRSLQVILDKDLATLYQVETKALNQAVKRNVERFPDNFRFQLTNIEKNELVTNCDRFSTLKHSVTLPYAFTEQGVSMLSAVLKSKTAVTISIQIMDAFVNMRKFIADNAMIFQRLNKIEQKQVNTDTTLNQLVAAIETKKPLPSQGIFFDGQVFDAYAFVANLIKSAQTSIVLIDNYIDETILTLLSKRKNGCAASIFTKTLSKQLQLDLKKHNAQYPKITITIFKNSHDRFLILDNNEIYHFGASLKDLGKKWFGFSRFNKGALEMLDRLQQQ